MNEPVYLRALEPTDLDEIYKWHNDRGLYETLTGPFHYVSKRADQSWLERKATFTSDEINLAVCVEGSDRHVGNIYLRLIDWISRHARLEILIGSHEERSKGYGQSAVRQLLSHAFRDLGLKTVYLHVLPNNSAAIHIYEKCGFTVEGRLKNRVLKEGTWKDIIIMSVCREDCAASQKTGDEPEE